MTATFYVGDAIEVMNKLPEKSVDLILTSPPFLALRSYLPADHPDKALEGGSQATPGVYIDWLIDVIEACDRVLAPHGSLCIELGDTYAGSSIETREAVLEGSARWGGEDGRPTLTGGRGGTVDRKGTGWPLAKSLSLIPELFRLTLVYGTNPLTGRQTDRWRLRNVVRWVRPNPPVGALGDKFRPATSELMVFCKSAKRYFDLDSVRGEVSEWTKQYADRPVPISANASASNTQSMGSGTRTSGLAHEAKPVNQQGAPPLDWWNIPPGGFSGAHYAVFPPELCIKPIKAMCPEKVCRQCGEPSRRIVETQVLDRNGRERPTGSGWNEPDLRRGEQGHTSLAVTTLGFSDCGHDDWRPGVVLDPFVGSGTTLMVATGHGRDAIGIDLDSRNFDLALDRVGPFILERAL